MEGNDFDYDLSCYVGLYASKQVGLYGLGVQGKYYTSGLRADNFSSSAVFFYDRITPPDLISLSILSAAQLSMARFHATRILVMASSKPVIDRLMGKAEIDQMAISARYWTRINKLCSEGTLTCDYLDRGATPLSRSVNADLAKTYSGSSLDNISLQNPHPDDIVSDLINNMSLL